MIQLQQTHRGGRGPSNTAVRGTVSVSTLPEVPNRGIAQTFRQVTYKNLRSPPPSPKLTAKANQQANQQANQRRGAITESETEKDILWANTVV